MASRGARVSSVWRVTGILGNQGAETAPAAGPSTRRRRVTESVVVERRGFTQLITINRPEVKNAVDGATARALAAAADELDADDELRVGVLTGAGGAFCTGMDLKAYLRRDKPNIEGPGFGGITTTPPRKPLIAAVEG